MENQLMGTSENQLAVIVKESGLEQTKAAVLLEKFKNYFDLAAEWEKKAKTIVVTKEDQISDMKMARVGRLALREKRIAIESTRKELKEQSLREGRAIDGIANVLKALIVPIEEYLDKQENFVKIKAEQEAELVRLEEEKKAEEDRIAKEKAEAEERERVKAENERLKKEADEREAARKKEQEAAAAREKALKDEMDRKEAEAKAEQERIQKEADEKAAALKKEAEEKEAALKKEAEAKEAALKAEQEKQLAKERAEKEAAEAELKAKKEEEDRLKREAVEKAEALKRASDRDKIIQLRDDLRNFPLPEVESAAAKQLVETVKVTLNKLADAMIKSKE